MHDDLTLGNSSLGKKRAGEAGREAKGKHHQQAGIGASTGGFRMRRRIIDVMPKSCCYVERREGLVC